MDINMMLYPQWELGDSYFCMLPVGQGDSMFIVSPTGLVILVDCGSDGVYSTAKFLGKLLHDHVGKVQAPKNKEVSQLIITHPHADHFSDIHEFYGKHKTYGIATLTRRKDLVDRADGRASERMRSGDLDQGRAEKVSLLKQMSDAYSYPADAKVYGFELTRYQIGKGWLDENHSSNDQKYFNNSSIVCLIKFGGHKILLTGDLESDGWSELLKYENFVADAAGATFIAASHHGHNSGWNPQIVEKLGKPLLWFVSTKRADPHCASAYSSDVFSKGIDFGGGTRRLFSTKNGCNIELLVKKNGDYSIAESTIDCSRNTNQQSLAARRRKQSEFSIS